MIDYLAFSNMVVGAVVALYVQRCCVSALVKRVNGERWWWV